MSLLVYAVTVNWNRPQDTIACLNSLLAQDTAIKLLLVDNGSTDNSLELIHSACPSVEVIETGSNLGFAGGFNVGIRHSLAQGADYVLIINNDTLADRSMVKHLLANISSDVGAVSPAIFYADEPERIWAVGSNFNPLLLELTDQHGRDKPAPTIPSERDFLTACALLVKREAFTKVGLFDERFFMYYEDKDFSLRMRQEGYRLMVVPRARLWHKGSSSTGGAESPAERYYMALSSGRYFRKHMRGVQKLIIPVYRLFSALRWTGHLIGRRKWDSLRAYWHGLLEGWFGS